MVIPNDPVNQGRALSYKQASWFTLKDSKGTLICTQRCYFQTLKICNLLRLKQSQTARAIDDVDLAFGYPHYLRLAKQRPNSALLLDDSNTNKRYAILYL